MKDLFAAIASLFVDLLFAPLDMFRALELENWTAANALNWFFMLIGTVAFPYWMKELKKFNDNDEENRDPIAHSFLN